MNPQISVAPMMDCTDRHDRYFLRLIAPHVQLYTEMITTHALMHANPARFLAFDVKEKYVALQLGGSDPKHLAYGAKLGQEFGYDEINLNVGCPSPRVSSGRFGACLMREPQLVADCVAGMQATVSIPVTVKCRIGVDEQDDYADLHQFIALLASAGCQKFIIHARKAWLSGLSPKENREIPPLRYDIVYQIKKDFPQLTIIINGGMKNLEDMLTPSTQVDGMMLGRAAYSNPYLLAKIEQHFFSHHSLTRHEVVQAYIPYIEKQLAQGVRLANMTRHILGLFHAVPGAANWRRVLSQEAHKSTADVEVVLRALSGAIDIE